MHHLYLQLHSNTSALTQTREALESWCKTNNITTYSWIEDDLTGKIQPDRLQDLLNPIHPGDTVVTYDIASLGRSLAILLQVMEHLLANRCTLISLSDSRTLLPNRTMTLFVNHLRDFVEIEGRMKVSRSLDIVHTKRTEGIILGRPKGAKRAAAKTVLHGKTDRLIELYQSGRTPAEIAELLNVSRGTVANYLKSIGLFQPYRR